MYFQTLELHSRLIGSFVQKRTYFHATCCWNGFWQKCRNPFRASEGHFLSQGLGNTENQKNERHLSTRSKVVQNGFRRTLLEPGLGEPRKSKKRAPFKPTVKSCPKGLPKDIFGARAWGTPQIQKTSSIQTHGQKWSKRASERHF